MAANNEEDEQVKSGLDLQSLPADALELIVAMLDRKEVTAVSGQCRSLREAALANFRVSLRRLLDRSARDLSALRNKALLMREQSMAGHEYSGLALHVTTARLVRMELRILAAASWRHLCAPSGPGLAIPGSLLDKMESVLDLVASGELTRSDQPEATANLFISCEKFLEFFSDALEPCLAITSSGWAALGSRIADTLAATHSRRIHKEAIARIGQSVRLHASYRLPGLVEAPPTLPKILNAVSSTPMPLTQTDRSAYVAAADRILQYLRRSVHLHNLVLVLKDQWALDDTLERRGSDELRSGFIFEHHDQQGECVFSQSDTKVEVSRQAPRTKNNDKMPRVTWDGLHCELHMVAPSIHLLPPHLQHVACQIWPQSSSVTLNSEVASCPSIRITSSIPKPSCPALISKAGKSETSCSTLRTLALKNKNTRLSRSLMAMNSSRMGDADELKKSLSFDNVDAVNQVLCQMSRADAVNSPSCSTFEPKTAKEIKTVDLSVVGNSCVCFTLSDLGDIAEDIKQTVIPEENPRECVLTGGRGTSSDNPLKGAQSSSQFVAEDAYQFHLQIIARYPEPNKTKSGLREATIVVVDSEDGPSAWLEDDIPVV